MIEKLAVRKMLASYEKKLKEEIRSIEEEIENMNNACATNAMSKIWHNSKEYLELLTKYGTLYEVLSNIRDLRCDEMLED